MDKARNEVWKDIKGYEGIYQVSNFGRVKSLERITFYELGGREISRFQKECIRKQRVNRWGYKSVNLNKNSSTKTFEVHRLVASHFLSGDYKKEQVNHVDSDKENNSVENLEFVSSKENIRHAFENNLMPKRTGWKLNRQKAKEIRSERIKNPRISHEELSMRYNVSVRTIIDVLNNVSWSEKSECCANIKKGGENSNEEGTTD